MKEKKKPHKSLRKSQALMDVLLPESRAVPPISGEAFSHLPYVQLGGPVFTTYFTFYSVNLPSLVSQVVPGREVI